jgi:polygalacturonase
MFDVENVFLDGYTVINSANWAHNIYNSKNITAKNIKVLGGHDGFDVRTCDDVLIENCRFLTGDDCIAGFDNINVTVRDCYFESSCSIFRFGATGMLVENCEGVAPATYGFRGSLSQEEKRNSENLVVCASKQKTVA